MSQTSIIRWVLVSGAVVAVARGRSTLTPDAMDILPGLSSTPGSPSSPGSPSKPYCEYAGEIYQVGEIWAPDPCSFCFCHDQNGYVEYNCHYGPDCFETLNCEYPSTPVVKPGQCCPSCSDGTSTSSTTTTSIRTTPITSTHPSCQYEGKTYQLGEEFKPEPCAWCTCYEDGVQCYWASCAPPMCSNPVRDPNECCAVCPDDVSPTTTRTQSSTTQPSVCIYGGETYQPGESFQPDPCTHCDCPPDGSGLHVCAIEDCFGPQCVDAIKDPTKCCPVCPNGPNCKHGDTIIPAGETVTFETGEICSCDEELPWSLEARCMETRPPSTTPIETTPPPPPPPPVTTNALSPKEAKSVEKEAQRQAKQEERQAKEAEKEARKAARKARRAERKAKRSPKN